MNSLTFRIYTDLNKGMTAKGSSLANCGKQIFADHSLTRNYRFGFYCFDNSKPILGFAIDYPGILFEEEYDKIEGDLRKYNLGRKLPIVI